jgi:hypothetical protein
MASRIAWEHSIETNRKSKLSIPTPASCQSRAEKENYRESKFAVKTPRKPTVSVSTEESIKLA